MQIQGIFWRIRGVEGGGDHRCCGGLPCSSRMTLPSGPKAARVSFTLIFSFSSAPTVWPSSFSGASTVVLQLNKILDQKSVRSPAFTSRHHHPQAQLVPLRPVGGKTDHDASGLRPVLSQWRGHSLAGSQLHATEVLQLALDLELKLHADVVGTGPLRPDFHAHFFCPLLRYGCDEPQGETRAGATNRTAKTAMPNVVLIAGLFFGVARSEQRTAPAVGGPNAKTTLGQYSHAILAAVYEVGSQSPSGVSSKSARGARTARSSGQLSLAGPHRYCLSSPTPLTPMSRAA